MVSLVFLYSEHHFVFACDATDNGESAVSCPSQGQLPGSEGHSRKQSPGTNANAWEYCHQVCTLFDMVVIDNPSSHKLV